MTRDDIAISVLVPVYNEADSLVELTDRLAAVLSSSGFGGKFEILFVDDGSRDKSPATIQTLVAERNYVRCVRLRRNWGKSLALSAGLQHAAGRLIITIDSDLQDHPEDIPKLLAGLDGGYDLVNGWRTQRSDTLVRRIGSWVYNRTIRRSTGLMLHDMNCGFKAYRREVASALRLYGQYHRYVPLQAHLAGFKVTEVPVSNSARRYGFSKFRTFRYEGLFDLMSLLFLNKYGFNPMYFFGVIGMVISIPSFLMLLYFALSQVFFWIGLGAPVLNRPLLSISLFSFLLGVLIFLIGFVCDFVLHHLIRERMPNIIGASVAEIVEPERKDGSA